MIMQDEERRCEAGQPNCALLSERAWQLVEKGAAAHRWLLEHMVAAGKSAYEFRRNMLNHFLDKLEAALAHWESL